MIRRLPLLAALLLALAAAGPAGAQLDRWTGGGPAAAVLFTLEVDPTDASVLYGASGYHVYSSTDGGSTWMRTSGLPAGYCCTAFLEVDPGAPGTVYAAGSDAFGGALLRSRDGGQSWQQLGQRDVSVLVAVPGSRTVLLAATYGEAGGLVRSTDGGSSWAPAAGGLGEDATSVYWLGVAPSAPGTVYALAGSRLYRTTDAGLTWEARATFGEGTYFGARSVDPADADTVYLAEGERLLRSVDGGASFAELPPLPLGPYGWLVALEPAGSALYALANTGLYRLDGVSGGWQPIDTGAANTWYYGLTGVSSDAGRLYLLTGSGVLATDDGGTTWRPAGGGLPGVATQAVAVGEGGLLYAGLVFGGVATSRDGGATWSAGSATPELDSVLALALDAAGPQIAYAGTYSGHVLRTEDAGATWSVAAAGLPRATVWGLAAHPERAGRVLAATEVGVYRLAAADWRLSSSGLPNTGVRTLVYAPSDSRIVYAGLDRGGAWASADGGRSWRAAGLGHLTVVSVAVSSSDPATVYAATARGGAFRSDDGGDTWLRIAKARRCLAIALDPADPDTVLLSTGRKVLRSRDGGATWTPFVAGLPARGGLPGDPEADGRRLVSALATAPGAAYAATWSGVYSVQLGEAGQ